MEKPSQGWQGSRGNHQPWFPGREPCDDGIVVQGGSHIIGSSKCSRTGETNSGLFAGLFAEEPADLLEEAHDVTPENQQGPTNGAQDGSQGKDLVRPYVDEVQHLLAFLSGELLVGDRASGREVGQSSNRYAKY